MVDSSLCVFHHSLHVVDVISAFDKEVEETGFTGSADAIVLCEYHAFVQIHTANVTGKIDEIIRFSAHITSETLHRAPAPFQQKLFGKQNWAGG